MASDRAIAPVIGVLLLATMTVLGASAILVVDARPGTPTSDAVVGLDADAAGEVTVLHRGGDPLDPETLELSVYVDGDPLRHQPPIPFFSATGFESAPTGAFNSATTDEWRAGESATLRIATTNEPRLEPGATVRIQLLQRGQPIAEATTTVRKVQS